MSDISQHKCFVEANLRLAPDNTEIDFAFVFSTSAVRPVIKTCKVDPKLRGTSKTLMASHCPFCGEKL